MAQVHEDIIRLKTQRMQIEAQIRAVIESHLKLLDLEAMQNKRVETEYEKLRRITPDEGEPFSGKTSNSTSESGSQPNEIPD
jgi:cell division initiation protein